MSKEIAPQTWSVPGSGQTYVSDPSASAKPASSAMTLVSTDKGVVLISAHRNAVERVAAKYASA